LRTPLVDFYPSRNNQYFHSSNLRGWTTGTMRENLTR
jgi:hypothetical protein